MIEVHDDLDTLLSVRTHEAREARSPAAARHSPLTVLASRPLQVVPAGVRSKLATHPLRSDLLEVIMDLGRAPEARFLVR